jgi:outer membrane protein TolC
MKNRNIRMTRIGTHIAMIFLVAATLFSSRAHAQSSGAVPRAPGELGPTPVNPIDSGFGMPQGVKPPELPPVTTSPVNPSSVPLRIELPAVVATPALGAPIATSALGSEGSTLPAALRPQPGGLTVARVVERALQTDAGMRAATAGVQVAKAQRLESGMQFIPSLSLSFRYTRLSEFTPASLPFFDGARCVTNLADCQKSTQAYYQPLELAPAILDQFALRGSITLPLSDIPLRLLRQYQAAGLTVEARRLDEQVTAAQVAQQASEAFYEYLRAVGQLAVARQSADSAERRRDDLRRTFATGMVPRADLLRAEAAVSDLERLQLLARNSLTLAEAQLRQKLRAAPEEALFLGEALDAPVAVAGDADALIRQALDSRPEIQSLDRQARALGLSRASLQAGLLPSLSASGNVDYANPNSRFFPQTAEFRTTWDVSLQLSFSPSQTAATAASMARLDAQRQQLLSQQQATRDGIELEVRAALNQAQAARAQIDVARSQLVAAEESYRMRSTRFGTGAATQTELREAETDLLRARLGVINAHVDLRIALCRLQRAVGERPSRGGIERRVAQRP